MPTPDLISPRTAVRRAVCSLLRGALPAWDGQITPERVHDSRGIPLVVKRLPAVLVYTRDERLDDGAGHGDPGLRCRTLEVAVEVVALDDVRADYLCAAVEALLDNNETLGNLVQGSQLKRVAVDRDNDGETSIVAARLDFEVTCYTRPLELPPLDGGDVRGGPPDYAGKDGGGGDTEPDAGTEPAILGMTPGAWETDEASGVPPRPVLILASTAPYIGKEYEPHYEPAPAPR